MDIFLKIDGLEGESTDERHKNEIELLSFTWGETHTTATLHGGAGAGRISMQDFHFAARTSKASARLFLGCANGKHFPSALLSVRKSGGHRSADYLTWRFTDVLVSSYQTAASNGEDAPTDQFSLNFAKIEVEYKPQKPDGSFGASVGAGWDVQRNAPV